MYLPPATLQVSMSSAPSLYGPSVSSTRIPRSLCTSGRPGGTAREKVHSITKHNARMINAAGTEFRMAIKVIHF